MKKFYFLFLAAAILTSTSLAAQRQVVRLTRYEGSRITGVSASGVFQVKLVKSNQSKAVIEIDAEAEPFLKFNLTAEGRVSVGIDVPRSEQQRWNRLQNQIRTMKLTLYLPELDYISLSGAATLSTEDHFSGDQVQIKLSGMAKMDPLEIQTSLLSVNVSGASTAKITSGQNDLNLTASGSARIEVNSPGGGFAKINASGAAVVKVPGAFRQMEANTSGSVRIELAVVNGEYAKIKASGAAIVALTGDVQEGVLESYGSARIQGEQFRIDTATLKVSGAGCVSVHVNRTIRADAAGSGKIQYTGAPEQTNTSTSGAGSIQRVS